MLDRLRPIYVVTKREMKDQLRDWRILIPIAILTLTFPSLSNMAAGRLIDFVGQYGAELVGQRMIPFLIFMVGFFPLSFTLVIALESFVGEKERGSIEPLLSSPLEDWQLYFGKFFAVVVPPVVAAFAGIFVYAVGLYRQAELFPGLDLMSLMLVLTFVHAVVMVSGAVVVSTQATSVRSANLMASFIIIPISFLIFGETFVIFWGSYSVLWWGVAGLIVISGVLVRTGLSYFNREEMLGREIDDLNIFGKLKIFWTRFSGDATNPWQWWRYEALGTLKSTRLSVLFALIMLVGAIGVGIMFSQTYQIPSHLISLDNLQDGQLVNQAGFSIFSTFDIPTIFFHNLRAIVIATLLGLFTYSVLGMFIIYLPFVIIAYFTVPLVAAGIPATDFLLAAVAPHGIFEIPAIMFAGAAIFRTGAGMATPGHGTTIGDGLLQSFADWAKIMVGIVIPLLLLASIMEVLVTPRAIYWLLSSL